MEPRIQYAQTKDGVSIAFYAIGEGIPLVQMVPFANGQSELDIPELRRYIDALARNRMLVRYDVRGMGLSDRDVTDFSLDGQVQDLEAVVNRLGLDTFALLACHHTGPLAITYAVRHPERVSHLVLWCSWARGSDMTSPEVSGLGRLLNTNWKLYTETVAHVVMGWSEGEPARRYAGVMRDSVTQEGLSKFLEANRAFDVTSLLPEVKSSTLVLHRRNLPFPDVDVSRRLASRIPNARLGILDGSSWATYLGDWEAVVSAIDEFLSEGKDAEARPELPEGVAVLLFADIAESTALTEQLGDAAFREKARELDTSLRSVIRECAGTPVEGKVLGDGVLAVFTSARQAIECALRCEATGEPLGLRLHVGIHAGDVIREGNNVYGGAVNIAARIAAASEPGEVLVSDTVRSLGRTSADVTFDDRGEHTLKGVGEPQRLFAVRGGG
jgi:class 3 adenylate cyclase